MGGTTSPFRLSADLPLIGQGESAQIFDLGDGRVLKLFRASVSDDMIEREAAASAQAYDRDIPTAQALDSYRDEGDRGIIYPYLRGDTVMRWIRKNPLRAGWALDQMAAIHRQMHGVKPKALRSLKQVLATDIAYGPAPQAIQDAAIAYLDDLPDSDRLTHGDFHLGNAMVTDQGLMVIDWSKAATGPAPADIVRSEMLMRFGVGPNDWVTNLWRDWAARRLRSSYLAGSSIRLTELDQWRPVVALAWLRARKAGRNDAFHRYLNRAMALAKLPTLSL